MTAKKAFLSFLLLSTMLPATTIAQVLETEDARPLEPGAVEIGSGLEFQTSKEGTETALPLAFEYGITKRLTALVEPVAFTTIHPKGVAPTTGFGDLEITLFYQLMREKKIFPSVTVSAEVKLPTAQNPLIGTGKTDFTPFIIASKTIGKFYTSANLSYTFLGKPPGVQASNLVNYAIGTIYTLSPKSILFGEIYGNTSALGGGEIPEGTHVTDQGVNTTELSGGETVGALGYGYYLKNELLVSFGVSYDNNNAVLFRPGIEWKFGGKKSVKLKP